MYPSKSQRITRCNRMYPSKSQRITRASLIHSQLSVLFAQKTIIDKRIIPLEKELSILIELDELDEVLK